MRIGRNFLSLAMALALSAVQAGLVFGRVASTGSASAATANGSASLLDRLQTKIIISGAQDADFAVLEKMVKADRTNARVRYVLGLALDKAGYKELAFEQYKLVERLDPSYTQELIDNFRQAMEKGQYARAAVTCMFVRAVSPREPSLMFLDGMLLRERNRPTEAMAMLQMAAAQDSSLNGLPSAIASICVQDGEYGKALHLVATDLARCPDSYEANVVKGEALMGLKRYGEASDAFAIAFRRHPDWLDSGYAYAESLIKAGKREQAAAPCLVEIACEMRPAKLERDKKMFVSLLPSLTAQQASHAIADAGAILKQSPQLSRLYFALADVYDRTGGYADACKIRLVGLHLDRRYAHGYFRMGESLERLGDFYNAQHFYAMASKLDGTKEEYKNAYQRALERTVCYQNDLAAQLRNFLQRPRQPAVDSGKRGAGGESLNVQAPGR